MFIIIESTQPDCGNHLRYREIADLIGQTLMGFAGDHTRQVLQFACGPKSR